MPKIYFDNKSEVYSHHLSVPYYQLEADSKKSVGKVNMDGNLIIQGDNLLALKSLMPQYAGRVKCIYIDPPYNTGNDHWVYSDKISSPAIEKWLSKVVDSEDLERHDKWLCMMYPRLTLLKELLAEDGVIFISIDDNEQHRLRMLMDEIFETENFIAQFVWRKKYGGGKGANFSVDMHEYIFCFAKDKSKLSGFSIKRAEERKEVFKQKDKYFKERGKYYTRPLKSGLAPRPTLVYPIKCPNGESIETQWICSEETFLRMKKEERIVFKKLRTGEYSVHKKFYENDNEGEVLPESIIYEVAYNQNAKEDIKLIFNVKEGRDVPFEYSKPVKLIQYILSFMDDKNSIILDSFAGSGTTAHATLAMNKEDGGNRKFILVQCDEWDKEKKKEVNVCDKITAERVRRVIKGVPKAKDESLKKGLGGSFTYATLGNAIDFEKIVKGIDLPKYEDLASTLFLQVTGQSFSKSEIDEKNWFIGETKKYRVYLIYKKDPKFLQNRDAMLTPDLLDKMKEDKKKGQKIIIFAAGRYVDSEYIDKAGAIFCYIPHEISGGSRE